MLWYVFTYEMPNCGYFGAISSAWLSVDQQSLCSNINFIPSSHIIIKINRENLFRKRLCVCVCEVNSKTIYSTICTNLIYKHYILCAYKCYKNITVRRYGSIEVLQTIRQKKAHTNKYGFWSLYMHRSFICIRSEPMSTLPYLI